MDFNFTQEQNMLRESLARYLSQNYHFEQRQKILATEAQGYSGDIWQALTDMGLMALPFPEHVGGLNGNCTDLVAVAEILGQYLFSEPYMASALLAGRLLSRLPAQNTITQLLEAMAEGKALCALAHEEDHGTADLNQIKTHVQAQDTGYILNGCKNLVLAAEVAGHFLVSARAGEDIVIALVDARAPGVQIHSYRTIDGRAAGRVTFDQVALTSEQLFTEQAAQIWDAHIHESILILCAEALGAMDSLLEQTALYASTRKQFGQPIGLFQAIAHRLADMKIACVKARATLLTTTALMESGHATPRDIAILKAQIGRLGQNVGESAIQIHGGVGMTNELAIGHYHKRLLAVEAMFGNSEYHLRRIGASYQM